jgi:prepilin-type N-terminal cleavage/methylation domain-containing protein
VTAGQNVGKVRKNLETSQIHLTGLDGSESAIDLVDRRGLSIVELLVAVVLIAVGALAAIVVQRTSVKENQRIYSREVAASLARQLLESVESLSYEPTSGTFANCLNATASAATFVAPCSALSFSNPLNAQGQTVAAGGYTRQWSIVNNGSASDATTAIFKTIRVRVQWDDRGQTQQVIFATDKGLTYPTSP